MATPKGMPEYAKGTASAIAASKKEAELTKKAKATPLANAPKAAISNAAATANANINKYDVAKANKVAENAVQKATIAKQVEKQALQPANFEAAFKTATSATPSSDKPLASFIGSAAQTAAQSTGAQQAGALNDLSLMAQQTYGTPSMAKAFEAAMPSNELPLATYMGEAAKYPAGIDPYGLKAMTDATYGQFQKVAPSTVQPLGMQLGQAAKDVALSNPATSASAQAQLQNLISSTYGEPAPTPVVTPTLFGDTLRAQQGASPTSLVQPQGQTQPMQMPIQATGNLEAIKDYYGTNVATGTGTGTTLGAPPIPFDLGQQQQVGDQVQIDPALKARLSQYYDMSGFGITAPVQDTTTTTTAPAPVKTETVPPSAEKSPYVALGEAAKTVPTVPPVPSTTTVATTGQTAPTKTTTGQATLTPTLAPTPSEQVIKGTPTEDKQVPDGFKDERGYTWNEDAGQWESPDVWANTLANRNRMSAIGGMGAPVTEAPVTEEPKVTFKPVGTPVIEQPQIPTTQEQLSEFDNFPSQYARAVVDKQIADANRQLDIQTEEAIRNRDLQTAQNLEAYKRALNASRDQGFIQNQQLLQQMANRGILTSGLAADAQTRLQMSMNQNIRDIAVKNQQSLDKVNADFKTAFDKLMQKRQDLEAGREGDIEKIVKGIQADNREMMKLDVDLRKLQLEENKTLLSNAQDVLKRYADQGYDTSAFEPYILSRDVQGLARAMQQSGQRPLSLVGEDMIASINKTNADIVRTQAEKRKAEMDIKQSLSQIDKQRSDTTGFVFQNGVALKDAKGNLIPTFEAKTEAERQKLKNQEVQIRKQEAQTARTKAKAETSTTLKQMSVQQQQNFLEDAVDSLYMDNYETRTDRYGDTTYVKSGTRTLDPKHRNDFIQIMGELLSRGDVNEALIRNEFVKAGLDPDLLYTR